MKAVTVKINWMFPIVFQISQLQTFIPW